MKNKPEFPLTLITEIDSADPMSEVKDAVDLLQNRFKYYEEQRLDNTGLNAELDEINAVIWGKLYEEVIINGPATLLSSQLVQEEGIQNSDSESLPGGGHAAFKVVTEQVLNETGISKGFRYMTFLEPSEYGTDYDRYSHIVHFTELLNPIMLEDGTECAYICTLPENLSSISPSNEVDLEYLEYIDKTKAALFEEIDDAIYNADDIQDIIARLAEVEYKLNSINSHVSEEITNYVNNAVDFKCSVPYLMEGQSIGFDYNPSLEEEIFPFDCVGLKDKNLIYIDRIVAFHKIFREGENIYLEKNKFSFALICSIVINDNLRLIVVPIMPGVRIQDISVLAD